MAPEPSPRSVSRFRGRSFFALSNDKKAGFLASGLRPTPSPSRHLFGEQWLLRFRSRLQWRDRTGFSPASLFIRASFADSFL